MKYLNKIFLLLDRKDQKNLGILTLFALFISVVETIGISAIMPFINIAINFDNIHSSDFYQRAFDFFSFNKDINFTIAFGFLLLGFYFFRGAVTI